MSGLDRSAAACLARARFAGLPSLAEQTPEAARAAYLAGYAEDQLPLQPVAQTSEHRCGTVRLKLWRGIGAPDRNAPAVLYLHGGGWVIGAPESHAEICCRIANRARAVVVAPDYRLAPEAPFPAATEDCARALQYLHTRSDDLGIDAQRIAVAGDSAGGNLAAVLALMARDGTLPSVAAQILLYPNTDQTQSGDSFALYADGFGLSATEMAWFRGHYMPRPVLYGDWRAAPLRAASLAGVAPATVVLAGHDVLYSEGAAYAERLRREARVSLRTWPGQIHGFISKSARIPEGIEALDWACDTALTPLR